MHVRSIAIPLSINNIDTDQIIPARFLKQVDKKGYGENLFSNWRYNKDGSINEDFELNKPERKGAQIIIAGNNFGCGSSREHAAWAVTGFGIKVVISSKFADIFRDNAYNNGILPVELANDTLKVLMDATTNLPETILEVTLEKQTIAIPSAGFITHFDIPPFKKQCLLEGLDEAEYLINLRGEIAAFEKQLV